LGARQGVKNGMVRIIASRAAGAKLGGLMAIILLPLLYMATYIVADLRLQSSGASAEVRGTRMLQLLVPMMLDAADKQQKTANIDRLLNEGPALADQMGISLDFNNLLVSLSMAKPDNVAVLTRSTRLARYIADASGFTKDGNPEAVQLALIATQDIPQIVRAFGELRQLASFAANGEDPEGKYSKNILMGIGQLSVLTADLRRNVKRAAEFSPDAKIYEPLESSEVEINNGLNALKAHAEGNFLQAEEMNSALAVHLNNLTPVWLAEYKTLWDQAGQRFETLIETNRAQNQQKVWKISGICLATILLALGLSLHMFSTTFKRLDEVEQAHDMAKMAQASAEEMAGELQHMNNDMVHVNQMLAQNMQMLKDAQDELVNKGRMEQMGQLTATIAHELRNPLGAVRTSTFMLARRIKDKGLGVEAQLQRINTSITRCDDIITQLLDFSRSSKVTARKDDFDKWLEKTLAEEAPKLPAAVSIQCRLGTGGVPIAFDPSRMHRALSNLLDNASEALVGKGDDPSRFANSKPEITIETWCEGGFAVLRVRDNGPGISPENLKKVTEPLFTTKSFGTGLGLPAVEQIVKQHGGALEVSSELGKGASFTLRLPLETADEVVA
jgi:signal transduction histidine kinase